MRQAVEYTWPEVRRLIEQDMHEKSGRSGKWTYHGLGIRLEGNVNNTDNWRFTVYWEKAEEGEK